MAYSLVVAGRTLYYVSLSGVATALTLPSGVTLSASRPPRFAILGQRVILTNNPNRSLIVDPDFTVRPLQLIAPTSPAVLSAGASGGLTGSYKAKYTHKVIDPITGALLAESDYSPESAAVSLSAKLLSAAGVSASPDAAVTHHGLYRTLANGNVYFPWLDLDAAKTTVADDLSDTLIPNLAATRELGAGPGLLPGTYMTQVIEWNNRLWGVGDRDLDTLRYSGDGQGYGWPPTYGLDIKPVGGDRFGITGLMPRRTMLGVGKREAFWRVSGGQTDEDGVPQWDVDQEKNGKGCYGPSLVVDDTAYYLGADGVYEWGADGFACPSDGRVRKWFATDDYFNRALFPQAFAKYNQRYDTIEWHLASAGSSVIDQWVSLDRATGAWFGPHTTDVVTPASAFSLIDVDDQDLTMIGGDDGVLYQQNQPGFSDAGHAIVLQLHTKHHDGGAPMIRKTFGAVSLVSKALTAIGNCLVRYRVGALDAPVSQTVAADMRIGTQTMPRIGPGEFVQLEITEDTDGAECQLFGYQIPFVPLSNRSRR